MNNFTHRIPCLPVALGQRAAQLVFKNAQVVDVFSRTVYPADVAIEDGIIVGIGEYAGTQEIDLTGKYLVPGLIDAHLHIESSMVSPVLFAKQIAAHGTTTILADPHEIVNVVGTKGLDYFLQQSRQSMVNIYFMLPSFVPLCAFDRNGAVLDAKAMRPYLDEPLVRGLGEVMDYRAVNAQNPVILEKMALFQDKVIDGHAPFVTGKALQAYRLAGVLTDHECTTYEEALERLRAGFLVQIREGSAARNLEAIITGVVRDNLDTGRMAFCTDDKHLEDIAREGHINYNIRKAIGLGLDPITAIQIATINAARVYGLTDLGAVAPGYRADLIVLDDLNTFAISQVYKDGIPIEQYPMPLMEYDTSEIKHTVHIPALSDDQFALPAKTHFPVIQILPGQITTACEYLNLPGKDGLFCPDKTLNKVAVIQRHDGSGRTAVGAVKGFGITGGAIASTVAHDAHNLIVLGDNDADMHLAVKALQDCQGGYTVVRNGKVAMTLPLPCAGLFTDDERIDVTGILERMKAICWQMGVNEGIDPFLNLSFLSLPVIPALRITDAGLFDVQAGTLL